eukprot:7235074-Prymnesium_polylepis.1
MAAASTQVALDIGWALSGVACGGLSVIVPLYQSELAPARLRGKLLSTVSRKHRTTPRKPRIRPPRIIKPICRGPLDALAVRSRP